MEHGDGSVYPENHSVAVPSEDVRFHPRDFISSIFDFPRTKKKAPEDKQRFSPGEEER